MSCVNLNHKPLTITAALRRPSVRDMNSLPQQGMTETQAMNSLLQQGHGQETVRQSVQQRILSSTCDKQICAACMLLQVYMSDCYIMISVASVMCMQILHGSELNSLTLASQCHVFS